MEMILGPGLGIRIFANSSPPRKVVIKIASLSLVYATLFPCHWTVMVLGHCPGTETFAESSRIREALVETVRLGGGSLRELIVGSRYLSHVPCKSLCSLETSRLEQVMRSWTAFSIESFASWKE